MKVLYNGQKKAELPQSGSGWYFKAGAYVQSNTSKGEGSRSAGEVIVYKADISHSVGPAPTTRSRGGRPVSRRRPPPP